MKTDQTILRFMGYHATGDLGPYTFYTTKRKAIVWFEKYWPCKEATPLQAHTRNKFRLAGYLWQALEPQQRVDWLSAQAKANLQITGYNLFVYYICTNDAPTIHTIERQAHLTLLPLEQAPP